MSTDKGSLRASLTMPPAVIDSTSVSLDFDDDESMLTDEDLSPSKTSHLSGQQSTVPNTSAQPISRASLSPGLDQTSADGDSITVAPNAYQLPIDPNDKNGKLKNKYVLADGTVVNGKGLGRGRPGFKRGPRKSALSAEVIADSSESVGFSTPSPASFSRSTSNKRKRKDSDYNEDVDDEEEDDDFDVASRDSTPEYNPSASTLTRSGRQSQKPAPVVTTSTPTTASAAKRPGLTHNTSSPSVKKHPKIKVKVYRGREQFALCEHCLRSNGPPGNDIVFCDACNRCWHQRCHEPRVTKEMIADTKAEWFCAECDKILHGKKRGRPSTKPLQPQGLPSIPPPPQPQLPLDLPKIKYGMPFIPGMALTLTQKKDYLHSLPKERLIDIIMRSAEMAPNMPIFETPYHLITNPANLPYQPSPNRNSPSIPLGPPPPGPISQPTSKHATPQPQLPVLPPPPPPPKSNAPLYDHPTAKITAKPNTQPPPSNLTEEDEGYYDDYDELALLYPKPGQGVYDLALPPEYTDYGVLLEGPECKTFSHWVKGQSEIKKTVEPWK